MRLFDQRKSRVSAIRNDFIECETTEESKKQAKQEGVIQYEVVLPAILLPTCWHCNVGLHHQSGGGEQQPLCLGGAVAPASGAADGSLGGVSLLLSLVVSKRAAQGIEVQL